MVEDSLVPFSYTGVVTIYFMAKHAPIPQVPRGRTCADEEWLISGTSPPCPNSRRAMARVVKPTLHQLCQVWYKILDWSTLKIKALEKNDEDVTSMAIALSQDHPNDLVSIRWSQISYLPFQI